MSRNFTYFLLAFLGMPVTVRCCDCRAPQPACAYLAADAIFLGRVSFTNDDGTGKFTQSTLVRFDVEERFKGVPPDVRQVWVDPGSFTSCYEAYRLGERYLMVATRKAQLPKDTPAMTIMRGGSGRKKPIPPGFDPAKPPAVYYAPECGGSRPADRFPNLSQDLAMLRAYRSGAALPRVLGRVYLSPFRGWPQLSGPALSGARVTMEGAAVTLRTMTNSVGTFSVAEAPVGDYAVWAELPPYRMTRRSILHVREVGCGYAEIEFKTTSAIQGIVLDHRGRPAPSIPVWVRLKDDPFAESTDFYALSTKTAANGQFAISGLPDSDLYLSAGFARPSAGAPYRLVYYPGVRSPEEASVLRLRPGEQRQSLVLLLETPIERSSAKVRVVRKNGKPAADALVHARVDGVVSESATTDEHGIAEIQCLRGFNYELQVENWRLTVGQVKIQRSSKVSFTCGGAGAAFTLLLGDPVSY